MIHVSPWSRLNGLDGRNVAASQLATDQLHVRKARGRHPRPEHSDDETERTVLDEQVQVRRTTEVLELAADAVMIGQSLQQLGTNTGARCGTTSYLIRLTHS